MCVGTNAMNNFSVQNYEMIYNIKNLIILHFFILVWFGFFAIAHWLHSKRLTVLSTPLQDFLKQKKFHSIMEEKSGRAI